MRTSLPLVAATVAALALVGCSSDSGTAPTEPASTDATTQSNRNVQLSTTFSADGGTAVTYDEQLVPDGAGATVTSQEADGVTTVTLEVTGLQPNRDYGAHAHVNPCGAEGADAGPHFQLEQDPVTPSVDPAYANPENEIWLDFTTDAEGAASAETTVEWTFPADRRAASVIIHAMPTATAPGEAGTAGDRAACVTVDF
ncbi:MAG TPA: superoxide dismutase family protein [Pseudonocardia sp.]|jgi:superoxide dismutase, Cu-Zn family|nr:superoxide dismutase family protein [Pseudonocardia sp.]